MPTATHRTTPLRRNPTGTVPGTTLAEHDCPVGGINLTRTPVLPAASVALPPDEFERRVALYAERAAERVCLFTGGGPPAPAAEPVLCWACGVRASRGSWVSQFGWATRVAAGILGGNSHAKEIYCPECFAEWGWPDRPLSEVG